MKNFNNTANRPPMPINTSTRDGCLWALVTFSCNVFVIAEKACCIFSVVGELSNSSGIAMDVYIIVGIEAVKGFVVSDRGAVNGLDSDGGIVDIVNVKPFTFYLRKNKRKIRKHRYFPLETTLSS